MLYRGSSSRECLIEQAKEELEILEYEQPNKFEYLKQDLRDFISQLLLLESSQPQPTVNSIYVDTQESSSSSNINKRKKVDEDCVGRSSMKKRSKTDAVLDRAQQCLNKIRHLKTSLSSSSS